MYPGGPPQRPYDPTAETLPLLFGVEVKAVSEPISGTLAKESFPFDAPAPAAYSASDADSYKTVAKLWKANRPVWRNEESGDFSETDKGSSWKKLGSPRIGLYRSSYPAMDGGWTRWLLENCSFAYKSVSNADLQAGSLNSATGLLVSKF